MLSPAAFNAFLKTLEEPPAYAKFILATTEKHKIIPTILSRCQIFDFRRISVEDIANYLAFVAKSEKIDAEIEALHIIAQKADGALRDALSTFDQIVSYSGNTLTYKNVIENLNILDYEYYFRVSEAILHADITELLLIFNEIIENGFDGQHFITGLTEHLRNLLIIKDEATLQLLLASPSLKEKYKAQSEQFDAITLLKAIDTCNKYDLSYKTSNNKRLHVEIALMQLSQISVTENILETKKVVAAKPKTINEPVKEYKKPVEKQKESKEEIEVVKEKKSTPKARKEENGRKVKNISIKDSLNSLKQTTDTNEDKPEAKIITEFNQESLLKAWNDFIVNYQEKAPSFANAIAKYPPQLRDNFVIEYMVDNQIVAGDLLNITSMLEFLKKELNNNQITLKPVVAEKSSQKTAYTDREKFEEMAKKYPGLIDLKEQLNLELDF